MDRAMNYEKLSISGFGFFIIGHFSEIENGEVSVEGTVFARLTDSTIASNENHRRTSVQDTTPP